MKERVKFASPMMRNMSPGTKDRRERAALFAAWLTLVLYLAAHHVFWRDEIRAFSLAMSGNSVAAMLRWIHGEGHPALWYLMLRGAHELVPVRQVLPAMALIVGAAAAALLALRAPFRPAIVALILFGNMLAFEYVVVARNYGIAMLTAFIIAAIYPKRRDQWGGAMIGGLLALLCNTSVIAALLAGGFLLFWLVELAADGAWHHGGTLRAWAVAAILTWIGAALAFVTVYPPYNDAASIVSTEPLVARILAAIADPRTFEDLVPGALWRAGDMTALLLILLTGSVLGLVRRPAALAAGVATLVSMSLFFHLVYPGTYRHEALLLVFLIALYWLVAIGRGSAWPERWNGGAAPAFERIGQLCFAALLSLQLVDTVGALSVAKNGPPFSRSREFGALLAQPALRGAIVLGHPDWVLEPLAYYASNPTYMLRQHAFARVARFSRQLPRTISLDDYLSAARSLREQMRRPVLIAIEDRLYPGMPSHVDDDGLAGKFLLTSAGITRFLAATRRIARFDPALTSESYDVYLVTG